LAIANGLFNCQHADIVIADAEMVVFSRNVGICDLIVKKLSGLGTAFDPAGPRSSVSVAGSESILPATAFGCDLNHIRLGLTHVDSIQHLS
jgi:hypothetical protein